MLESLPCEGYTCGSNQRSPCSACADGAPSPWEPVGALRFFIISLPGAWRTLRKYLLEQHRVMMHIVSRLSYKSTPDSACHAISG